MRTTVDLPPAVHRRASELARAQHRSLSAVVSELAVRGLASLDEPVRVDIHPATGLPSIRLGRTVTSAQVAELLDDA